MRFGVVLAHEVVNSSCELEIQQVEAVDFTRHRISARFIDLVT